MSEQQLELFLSAGMMICAVMIVISVLQVPRRGPSSYLLALAYADLGLLLYGFRTKWPYASLGVIGVVLFLCLAGDFVLRTTRRQGK
jgi:hypothetical protein